MKLSLNKKKTETGDLPWQHRIATLSANSTDNRPDDAKVFAKIMQPSSSEKKIEKKGAKFKRATEFVAELERKLKSESESTKTFAGKTTEEEQIFADKVLQMHRKCFEELLTRDVTRRSLLSQIREAYENSLNVRDKRIKLHSTMMRVANNEKQNKDAAIDSLLTRIQELSDSNKKLDQENSTLKTTIDKVEKETLSNYLAITFEREARYTLYAENLKLKNDNAKLVNFQNESIQDMAVLNLALERSRQDLSKITKKYNVVIDEYKDTVPTVQYEKLDKELAVKIKEYNKTFRELKIIREELAKSEDERHKLNEEVSELREKLCDLETTGTPRPDWNVCGEYIGGGRKRWIELTKKCSSREKLLIILNDLGPTSQRDNSEYFEGLGVDPMIPEYLRFEGQIRNLKLSRRDLSIVINDIWSSKISEERKNISLQDFLTIYFRERYEQEDARIEWVYNLYWGCKKMLNDSQIKLFWGALNGTQCEDVYYAHKNEWDKLKNNLLHDNSAIMSIGEIEQIFRKTFPMKSDIDVKSAMDVVKKKWKTKSLQEIEVTKLFYENEEGFDRNEIAKELFRQQHASQEKYIREIIIQLGGKKNYNKLITVDSIKRAFAIIDPHIDHVNMESYIRWVYSDRSTDLNMIYPIPLKIVAAKLAVGNIQRVGPRYKTKKFKFNKSPMFK